MAVGERSTKRTMIETAVYGTVRTVVWEDGGGNAPSYPIKKHWSPVTGHPGVISGHV